MRNVLITGGAGFIGSHLVDLLLSEGSWCVTVVDDFNDFYSPTIKSANIEPHSNNPNFSLFEINICEHSKLREVFARQNFDIIVHLAARAGVRPSLAEPLLYAETNINGTLNLLELAREFNVPHFVFGSSSSVYGCTAKVPFSEDHSTLLPISPYAVTKVAGEMLCHTYAHLYNIRSVCLRFFTVYGSRQRPDLAIHKFARLIASGKPIPVYGDGTTRRDYTYIKDIIAGVRAALDYTESYFEAINLGESRTVQLREVIELLETNLKRRAIVERLPPQPGDVLQTFADISKAQRLLGYNPSTPFAIGVADFVQWFSQQNSERFVQPSHLL